MPNPPVLTDRIALDRNRRRATTVFPHESAAAEIEERLAAVNRSFTAVAVVTPCPAVWAARWPQARIVPDGPVLDLPAASFDLVIHAMALHWAEDPPGQIIQCARALRPDGLFIAALPGGRTLHELRACLAEAEVSVTGGLSPRVLPMADIRDAGALLQRAGLAMPVADSVDLRISYADPLALMRDLRAMGEGNALAGRLRRPTRRAVIAQACVLYAERFALSNGKVAATFETLYLTGWAPHRDQPQPLRPGSAARRLADALRSDPERGATPQGD
ncbi:MAG: methyltransferase domain-containing protein [Gemmobacter sp.]